MLKDIFESSSDSMYDPEDDQNVYKITDSRKPKLTLQVLNNLRKYREFKAHEEQRRKNVVAVVYAATPTGDGSGLM
ncbi:hypothetical protein AAAA58_01240 [Escherichia coli]|uniref:hypothetical protein n=1 Tax=Escherichia coli TaxID=562 RepID=UPI000A2E35FF|nr:hypothetical protein B1K96_14210 [Escherichia coli]